MPPEIAPTLGNNTLFKNPQPSGAATDIGTLLPLILSFLVYKMGANGCSFFSQGEVRRMQRKGQQKPLAHSRSSKQCLLVQWGEGSLVCTVLPAFPTSRYGAYHLLSANLYLWSSAGTMSIRRMYFVLGLRPVTFTL